MANITNFLGELRRRNVFKVGVAYAIVAWLIIQIASTAFPALHLPPWAITLVTVFIIIGFPLILLFAWAFELTPEGFKPAHHVVLDESITHITGRKIDFAIIGLMAVVIIYLVVDNYIWVDEKSPAIVANTTDVKTGIMVDTPVVTNNKSIAVLPFADMSAAGDQVYFGDGIAEEILNGLAKVKELRVAARTSAFTLRGESIGVVGEKLNVNHVLEGSVRKSGDRLRITTQLIKVDDGFHVWSQTYDRDLTDIFVVQDEIAKAVVDALKIELGVDAVQLVTFGTTNREAYDWYLRGKDALVVGTAEGFQNGVDYFKHAIEIDPIYADAYAYLAYAHILQHPFTPYEELTPIIKQAYSKALELEPSHSEALCAQGYDKIFSDWDWSGAGKLFRAGTREGKLNDVCLGTYIYVYLGPLGQSDKSIAMLRDAERADPLNLWIKYLLGNHLSFYGGELEEGNSRFHVVLDAAPSHVAALRDLTQAYLEADQIEKAESVLARLENLNVPDAYPYTMISRVKLEVLRGNSNKAQPVYDEGLRVAESSANKSPDMWLSFGLAAIYLGHLDEAISWFNRSFEEGAWSIVFIRAFVTSWPSYTQGHGPALMAHPDFQSFLKRMNLDDVSMAALQAED